MPEAGVLDNPTALDYVDPHASSSLSPHLYTEGGHAEEDLPDSGRDARGQRGSFRGWSGRFTRRMSKLKTNKADGQASHFGNMDLERGGDERSESRKCEQEALHDGVSDGERRTIRSVGGDELSAQPPKAYDGPKPHMRRGQAGRLLQALRSSNAAKSSDSQIGAQGSQPSPRSALKVVPPASPPQYPRPQTKSWWRRLSRGRNRKEEDLPQENNDTNEVGYSLSSSSLGPIMTNGGLDSIFHPVDESRQRSLLHLPPPPASALAQYVEHLTTIEPCAANDDQAV